MTDLDISRLSPELSVTGYHSMGPLSFTTRFTRLLQRHWDTLALGLAALALCFQLAGQMIEEPIHIPITQTTLLNPPVVYVVSAQTPIMKANNTEVKPKEHSQRSSAPHYPRKKPKPTLKPASISINQASLAQLDLLPGVGEKLATRIIAYRKQHGAYDSLEALKAVKGIGSKNFEKLKPFLCL